MTDLQAEWLTYLTQIIVLVIFAFILNDILAALIVSFLSRPLAKMGINFFKRNLNKKQNRDS